LEQGHTRQVSAVAFSPDGRKAVTASQDHSMQIWNLAVRYQQQEDPKCLVNVQQQVCLTCIEHLAFRESIALMLRRQAFTTAAQVPNGQSYELLAFGAHGVIAAALGRTLHMIDSASGAVMSVIDDAHSPVAYLQWSPVPRLTGETPALSA
jgi:hypothetical protein